MDDIQLNRATLQGLLVRLNKGLMLLPGKDTNPANSFHGYYTEAYELTGDGKADVYVDGVVIHATWHHPDPNVPAVYLDANGNPIELDNGLTWVHVIGSQKWHGGI